MAADIREWLESLGLDKYADAFAENEIDLDAARDLTEGDLKELGIAMGARKKLLRGIAELSAAPEMSSYELSDGSAERPVSEPQDQTRYTEAERRQLTIMFCDLVGSTALSTKLDPEDLREVLRAYQGACAKVIAQYDGYIAKYMGDGVLVYFGYPRAHENDAERAARAGLDLIAAVTGLGPGTAPTAALDLAVRVGIDTGLVVVGDIVGEDAAEEASVVGETPNVAARLQGLARPNEVVIGALTRDLVGDAFTFDDLGEHHLKGIAKPVQAWRVLGEDAGEGRDEVWRVGGGLPLVGRREELGLLVRSWEASKEGHGQAVLIQGEAGIGKSRLIEALREHVSGEGHTWVANRCSPYHANSTLYPVIEHLKRVMAWKPEDSAEERFEKLEAALGSQSLPLDEAVPLYAELMAVLVPEGRYQALSLSADQKREQTLDALAGWLLEEAEQRPVVQVWEDLHWADPTTLELLGLYIEQSPTVSMLDVLTYRPEFVPPWTMRSHMTPITLNRLERPEAETLIGHQAGGKKVPPEVVRHIVDKADGVPLYVEELTKTILGTNYLNEEADRYTLTGPLSEVAIPASLQDSLMARLDRLPTLREVAQIGAVLGREFAYEMLRGVAGLEESQLQSGLEQLVADELLYQRGRFPHSRYIFKHALIQDAAYQSLLKRTRKRCHQRVAEFLEVRFPETAETEPELLAHHYSEAGLAGPAIVYWRQAGQRASERSASLEAIAHLTKGLELVQGLPETADRAELELDLQIILGPPLMSTKGWGAPEVERAYLRARELCRKVGENSQIFTVTWGLWHHYQHCGWLETAKGLADEMLDIAERQSDKAHLLQAHHAAWTTYFSLPELRSCRDHAEQGIALYKLDEHRSHAFNYGGHDPGVCCRVHAAVAAWLLGYADQALENIHDAVSLAEELAHPHSLVQALSYSTYLHQLRHDTDLVQERAEAVIALCTEQGIAPHYLAGANILRGWAMAVDRRDEEGIAQMHQGLVALRAKGAELRLSYYLALLGEAYGQTDEADQGLKEFAKALDLVEKLEERTWEAEVYRLKGILLLSGSVRKPIEAEVSLNQAIEVARRQSAKYWELRAATQLARLWLSQGKTDQARDLLAPIYEWFTEGFDTPDLKDAKALLDELN